MHGLPLQARFVAANGTVLTTSNVDPGAHGMNRGQSKMNGANDESSGHGMAKASRHTARRIRPLQPDTAGGLSPPGTGLKETTASSWPASQQNNSQLTKLAGLSVQCRLMEGVRWCWPLRRRAQTYLTVRLPPTYRLCLSPYLPTPSICKTQFSPNLIFFFFFFCYFYFIFISPYFPL